MTKLPIQSEDNHACSVCSGITSYLLAAQRSAYVSFADRLVYYPAYEVGVVTNDDTPARFQLLVCDLINSAEITSYGNTACTLFSIITLVFLGRFL